MATYFTQTKRLNTLLSESQISDLSSYDQQLDLLDYSASMLSVKEL